MHEWTMRDLKGPRGTMRVSKVDQTGLLKIKLEHGRPNMTIRGAYGTIKDHGL